MANTRNSQKRENDDAPAAAASTSGTPVVADSNDGSNAEPTMSDLLDSKISNLLGTLQSELQSIKSQFQTQFANHNTRLDRIENQLAT